MASLMPVDEALARVLAGAEALPEEMVPLAEADGRVLARDVISLRTHPPRDLSAMDGYALRAGDGAASRRVIGESAAGHPFVGRPGANEAVRIFTGAPLPGGTDSIVIQEDVTRDGDAIALGTPPRVGQHVRPRGLDFAEGVVGLTRGMRLNPRRLALAAAMNHASLAVHRRPRVAILSTGDELVAPGSQAGPDAIVSSNATLIAAMMAREDAEVSDLGICPDRFDATKAAIENARLSGFHVLLTSGGASVGDHDHMGAALAAAGADMGFWRIAMRPGKPLMMGRLGAMRVLGLPGNPVSSFVCTLLFALPLIARLSGRGDGMTPVEQAVLGADMKANDLRADFVRATLSRADGSLVATADPIQDSSMIGVLARSDCLIMREPFAQPAKAGDICRIIRLTD